MGVIGGAVGYGLLRAVARGDHATHLDGSAYQDRSKLEILFGDSFWSQIQDKVVIDFGCGTGAEAIEMAKRGAGKVIGVDIQERFLQLARQRLSGEKLNCEFTTSASEPADVVVSVDCFEHFGDPAAALVAMRRMLKPTGRVLISFGPTWYHPYGGHLFSVFPWAHLIFTERALMRWRSEFKSDGATRFSEVAGGLNQMTIRRFERLVADSPFRFEHFENVPIKKLRRLSNGLTREFTTAIVRCALAPRAEST